MEIISTPINEDEMLRFLRQHDDTSLFLMGNYEEHGPYLTEAPNSGNFKCVRSDGEVVAVFCLARRGNLLVTAQSQSPEIFEALLSACLEEEIPISGLLGEWNWCSSFWSYLKEKGIIREEVHVSKEILYSTSNFKAAEQSLIRQLKQEDFALWLPLYYAYLEEQGIPCSLGEELIRGNFNSDVEQQKMWGYFLDDKLVAMADLNAKAQDLGQVGGVYTIPSMRRKGLSRAVMQQLMHDVQKLHGIRKLIIFTGNDNLAARKLYESLGVEHVGYFGMFFGNA